MKNASELLEEAVYAGNLSENEEKRLYSWIESLILAKRKSDEYEAKAEAWDKLSVSIRDCNKEIELKGGLDALDTLFRNSKKGQIVQRHIDCFESGESDAKK